MKRRKGGKEERRKGGKEERRKGGKEERRKGGKEERRKGGNYKKTLISLVKKGKQLLQGCLYALLGPLRSAHRRLSFNFANKEG